MGNSLLLAAGAAFLSGTALASSKPSFEAVSWSDPRIDLFGTGPDGSSFWHKFYTGYDWQPSQSFERVPATDASDNFSTSSWGEGRFDLVYVGGTDGNVLHKYYGGNAWGPSWEGVEDLGGFATAVASNSWGENRLDIVAKSTDDTYIHKAWTGQGWFPTGKGWENFGGKFASGPAVASWGPDRLDIVGIADFGALFHKYWQDGWSEWEHLGAGPFVGTPRATSWGNGRLDIWAIDAEGQLNHIFWDGHEYQGWENLGGSFNETPQVAHWSMGKIDILGSNNGTFVIKSFDGTKWNPSPEGYYNLGSHWASEPALIARRDTNFLSVFGIDDLNILRTQIWTGYDWQPSAKEAWPLGDLTTPWVQESEEL